MNTENTGNSSNRPDYRVCARVRVDNQEHLPRIGAGWKHGTGGGINAQLTVALLPQGWEGELVFFPEGNPKATRDTSPKA